jgi:DMSO/TMAO reductase YedYZ molybdopterin-dependent catalytic subunit
MLAYEMDGAPLSRPHGAPVRLVMPEMYGYKNVKWVTYIKLEKTPHTGFWEDHGYDANGWVDENKA